MTLGSALFGTLETQRPIGIFIGGNCFPDVRFNQFLSFLVEKSVKSPKGKKTPPPAKRGKSPKTQTKLTDWLEKKGKSEYPGKGKSHPKKRKSSTAAEADGATDDQPKKKKRKKAPTSATVTLNTMGPQEVHIQLSRKPCKKRGKGATAPSASSSRLTLTASFQDVEESSESESDVYGSAPHRRGGKKWEGKNSKQRSKSTPNSPCSSQTSSHESMADMRAIRYQHRRALSGDFGDDDDDRDIQYGLAKSNKQELKRLFELSDKYAGRSRHRAESRSPSPTRSRRRRYIPSSPSLVSKHALNTDGKIGSQELRNLFELSDKYAGHSRRGGQSRSPSPDSLRRRKNSKDSLKRLSYVSDTSMSSQVQDETWHKMQDWSTDDEVVLKRVQNKSRRRKSNKRRTGRRVYKGIKRPGDQTGTISTEKTPESCCEKLKELITLDKTKKTFKLLGSAVDIAAELDALARMRAKSKLRTLSPQNFYGRGNRSSNSKGVPPEVRYVSEQDAMLKARGEKLPSTASCGGGRDQDVASPDPSCRSSSSNSSHLSPPTLSPVKSLHLLDSADAQGLRRHTVSLNPCTLTHS